MNESRLEHLESCIAFQEKTIQDLSDVLCRQQKELDALKAQVEKIVERMDRDEQLTAEAAPPEHETPPHY